MHTRVLPNRITQLDSNRVSALAPAATPAPAPVPVQAPVTYGNVAPVVVYQPIAPTNSNAVVALVLGLISFTTSMFFLGFVGIIFGHIARSQIKKRGERGNGMAVAGLWLGYISVIFWVGFWLVYFGIIALIVGVGIAAESGTIS